MEETANHRRSRVLNWILAATLALLGAMGATLLVRGVRASAFGPDLVFVALMVAALAASLRLNRSGKYLPSLRLTLAATFLGPWVLLVWNAAVLGRSFVPVEFLCAPILLAATFLPIAPTLTLVAADFAGLLGLYFAIPSLQDMQWGALSALLVMMSALSVAISASQESNLRKIEGQARALREAEERMREMSLHDPLTGLFNRRYLDEMLEREFSRCDRNREPIGVVMIDVDLFKEVNDTKGHMAGDRILRQTAALIHGLIRNADIACRYGGDEFLLVMPQADHRTALMRAQLIRKRIAEANEVTVSAGVASYGLHGKTAADVLGAADAALYEAKRLGRDRVISAGAQVFKFREGA
jgi:diguanylate cyclase (GGDEF)-like protein